MAAVEEDENLVVDLGVPHDAARGARARGDDAKPTALDLYVRVLRHHGQLHLDAAGLDVVVVDVGDDADRRGEPAVVGRPAGHAGAFEKELAGGGGTPRRRFEVRLVRPTPAPEIMPDPG